MKQLKQITLGSIALLFMSCGGTSYHKEVRFDDIDNSEMTPYSNQYGYFGCDVIFGEECIVGNWILYHTQSNKSHFARFYDDGIVVASDGKRYAYGVSRDGLTIRISTGERIEIISSRIYRYLEGHPCYRVSIVDQYEYSTADMCPTY